MKSRKQRRLEARESGLEFVPQYGGNSPINYKEYSGIGYERFNNRFVQFDVNGQVKESSKTKVASPISGTIHDFPADSSVDVKEEEKKTGLLKRLGRIWSKKK